MLALDLAYRQCKRYFAPEPPRTHPEVAWREPSGCAWDLPIDAQARTQPGSQRRPWPRGAPYRLDHLRYRLAGAKLSWATQIKSMIVDDAWRAGSGARNKSKAYTEAISYSAMEKRYGNAADPCGLDRCFPHDACS